MLTFTPAKFDGWLAANHPNLISRDNPLRLANHGTGTELDPANWPESAGPAPTIEEVEAWESTPLTDVEIATGNFKAARIAAPEYLDGLKGTVWAALKAGGMSPDEATAAGVGLVLLHGPLLAAFEAAGGHPVAGAALYAAIASPQSVAALPWLTAPILAIFAAALTPK